ncbi:MAG TPA: dihydroorotase [Steroidobacteraceae bacterium]|nr:dihydroorotase [Steroidobacteraceae bacterium]
MKTTPDTLTLRRPDDWHIHLRDGAQLAAVLPFTARQFGRALVMPNLKPPMTTTATLAQYRDRIRAAVPAGLAFEPMMTLYLTDGTTPEEIRRAGASGYVVGAKLYPAGATTHSDAGVTSIDHVWPALEAMAEQGLVLQVHGEVTDPAVDVFDREQAFIDRVLSRVVDRISGLKVVFEHITTRVAAQFVRASRKGVAATITPQHLLLNRNAIFEGGLRPHHYCLPVLKREQDREALLAAATSDDARFFLGTDSAPHAQHAKEAACGCAGVFSAHAALELYAEAFEQVGRLERLEAFASERGADFYGRPRNSGTVTLRREPWTVPDSYEYGSARARLVPFRAGGGLAWRLVDDAA